MLSQHAFNCCCRKRAQDRLRIQGCVMSAEKWEVARKATEPATFVVRFNSEDCNNYYGGRTAYIVEQLFIYQEANQHEEIPYPFIVSILEVSRYRARLHVNSLLSEINYQQKMNDLCYTIAWWWRTPSNSGVGELRIGFRLCGLYEMI
jgi:hypothetical protein